MPPYSIDDESTHDLDNSLDDTTPDMTADEIGEHTIAEFYKKTWGEHLTPQKVDPQQDEFAELTPGPGTLYVGGLRDIAQITSALFKSDDKRNPPMRPPISPELIKRRAEVREYAVKTLGSERTANAWFERPMALALGRRRPAEHLQTLEGCDAVEEFLRSLYPPEGDKT